MHAQLHKAITSNGKSLPHAHASWYVHAMERLVHVVQELSHARDLDSVVAIVRLAARELTGADGATFVLRDGDCCYYLEENAISPLWKGKRFPLETCISGWVMCNATPVVIEDIYADPRIPIEAYRPTFVKSLAMVPIRHDAPIAAIGNYWARQYCPSEEELLILQALADTTSLAMANAELYTQLQTKIHELQTSNYELSRFVWVACHDLQEPLRTISTQMELLAESSKGHLQENELAYVHTASTSANSLQDLIRSLFVHSTAEKVEEFSVIDMNVTAQTAIENLTAMIGEHGAIIHYDKLPMVKGNAALLTRVMQNLISNGIKFQPHDNIPHITIECICQGPQWIISVSDNGIGIEPHYFQRIFGFFQRLHAKEEYPGAGIGLATCKKIIELHGGRIWVESLPMKGTVFYFTLPAI